ncbi:K(+)-transporting ATPase subunit F [Nakamurella panacisegetis]|nr:K(+)-transporting ATPase subunit F [Nakamurella panacisegetis]
MALRGNVMTVVAAAAAIGLLVYLFLALLKPERF